MKTYIIGDIQGCFDSLNILLEKIDYNPTTDRLGFVGDLVNRGPKSLETLRFISELKDPLVVLGNHDLHLIALHYRQAPINDAHTLGDILSASDCPKLIDWLLSQPLLYHDTLRQYVLVHAGIPPQWSIEKACNLASEASRELQKNPILFLKNIYGNKPTAWNDNLTGWDRLRYIVNGLTRMRFCQKNGDLSLENKSNHSSDTNEKPWFKWHTNLKQTLYFGHWAALNGKCDIPNIIALDTGCVWGGKLTAVRLEDKKIFSVEKSASELPADFHAI